MTKSRYKDRKKAERAIRARLTNLLRLARDAGFVLQVEVGRPAPRRQAVTPSSLYLRPLDGSDQCVCSCCGRSYEFRPRSGLPANYLPLNWCAVCKERLREGESEAAVLAANSGGPRGQLGDLARASEAVVRRHLDRARSAPGPTHAEATGREVPRAKVV